MGTSKQRRQISKLIQLLVDKYSASTLCVSDIADCLELPENVVEAELKQSLFYPVYALYCGYCGSVMAHYESPRDFKGYVECPDCHSQPESVTEKDFVRAYVVRHYPEWDDRWDRSELQAT